MESLKKRSLAEFSPGDHGVVQTIDLPPERQLHFLELGLTPGETVQYVRKSPFGDPIIIEVVGVQLAIRVSDASAIIMQQEIQNE